MPTFNDLFHSQFVWGLLLGPAGLAIKIFFLACVLIAGIFGALTASRKILFVQALPGLVALVLVLLSR